MAELFDYVNSINKKEGLTPRIKSNDIHGVYKNVVINKQFSLFPDTILYAQEMNIRGVLGYGISDEVHFAYLYESIKPGKRYAKWPKPEKSEYIDLICAVYGYSKEKAKDVVDLFNDDDIKQLQQKVFEGGTACQNTS